MPNASAADRVSRLRAEIQEHDRRYYREAAPIITDLEYDRLLSELRSLEDAHPELRSPDSPTQRLGDQPLESLAAVRHRLPMLSIENTYSIAELRAYCESVAKQLDGEPIAWVVELKIDGVAVSLTYEDGLLVQAATRGTAKSATTSRITREPFATFPLGSRARILPGDWRCGGRFTWKTPRWGG